MKYRFEQFLNARSAYGPTVDASGERVYFISDITGSPQLWSTGSSDDSWPEPVGVGFDRVLEAHPSPRPGRLALAADVGGNERTQLYLLDGQGSMPRPLTENAEAIHAVGGWHPDGRTLAFASNERNPRWFDVYMLEVESGERRRILEGDATFRASTFSPDGRSLLVQRVDTPSDQTLLVVDIQSGRAARLTDEGEPSRYEHPAWSTDGPAVYCVTDRDREMLAVARLELGSGRLTSVVESEWDVDDFALSPDGRRLVYETNESGCSRLWVRELLDGHLTRLEAPDCQAYESHRWHPTFSWFPDSSRCALALSTPTRQADVFVADVAGGRLNRLTSSWLAGLEPEDLARPEMMAYRSFDGLEIPVLVLRPRNSGANGAPPALFYVHGGPESQTRAMFNPVIQYMVQRGFTVVAPNVRGSSGYGKRYAHLDDVGLRMDAVRDVAEGAAWAARSGLADARRIGIMGASYGGFMVLAALAEYPDRWAAGVDIVGIANFVTFLEQTGPWRRHLREAEYGSLERDRELLEKISPIHKADRIATPLMVIHGANDPRVPIGEAEQIVSSLRERGRPVELLRFEDEGHGLVKLRNRLVAYPRVAAFLERHLAAL